MKPSKVSLPQSIQLKSCDIFCFNQCSSQYDQLILRRQPTIQSQKVSLKRLNQSVRIGQKNLTRISSNPIFESSEQKMTTNRSGEEEKEKDQLLLFRKKNYIQNQLELLDKEMIRIGKQHQKKLLELRGLRDEIHQRNKDLKLSKVGK